MSVLDRLSHAQGRRDEIPNQELAQELAEKRDQNGIKELINGIQSKDTRVQSDGIKVLYEIGSRDPELIAPYAGVFIDLLRSKNNRLVWGCMTALGTIAGHQADTIFERREDVIRAIETGSVITVDNGIQVLAAAASHGAEYRRELFPYLLQHLKTCRPKDVPQHAEKCVPAVKTSNKEEFISVLEGRLDDLKPSQEKRVRKVIRQMENI
jgi:hypothetical protein